MWRRPGHVQNGLKLGFKSGKHLEKFRGARNALVASRGRVMAGCCGRVTLHPIVPEQDWRAFQVPEVNRKFDVWQIFKRPRQLRAI
jgi:hypothetical protein